MDNEPNLRPGNRNILSGGSVGQSGAGQGQSPSLLASLRFQQQALRERLSKIDTAILALESAPEAAAALDDLNRA